MQLPVVLMSLIPRSVFPAAALNRWQRPQLHALGLHPPPLPDLLAFAAFTLHRLPDAVIGLSCIAIAATLISFLISSGKRLPFRTALIVLASVVTLCGFTHMLAAVLPASRVIWLAAYLTFLAAVLALLTAALLPFVLPFLLSVLRSTPAEQTARETPNPTPVPIPETAPTLSILPASMLAPAEPTSAVPISATPTSTPTAPATPTLAAPASPPATLQLVSLPDDARLLAATESSLDAFFTFAALRDLDGKVTDFTFTWLNSNGERLLHTPRHQILGATLTQLLPLDPAPNSFNHYRLVLLTGKPYIHEFPLRENDVHGTWMRHHAVKLDDGIAITVTDITERRHSEQYLLHLAQRDPLTGLPNRTILDDRLQQAIVRANRYQSKVAVFFLNLNAHAAARSTSNHAMENGSNHATNHAAIYASDHSDNHATNHVSNHVSNHQNDNVEGQVTSYPAETPANRASDQAAELTPPPVPEPIHYFIPDDQLISLCATRLRSAIRSTDSIIRLGGNEFVVIMSDIVLETDIRRAAATLVAVLTAPAMLDSIPLAVCCNLGISIYPDTAATAPDLLIGADVAMYRAQSQGRNKYALFSPTPLEDLQSAD